MPGAAGHSDPRDGDRQVLGHREAPVMLPHTSLVGLARGAGHSPAGSKQPALSHRSGLAPLAALAGNQSQDPPSVPRKGKLLTRERSFPVAIAMADSKQPVVEKVQQLPQAPCVWNHDVPWGLPPPQNPGAERQQRSTSTRRWHMGFALCSSPAHGLPCPSRGGAPGAQPCTLRTARSASPLSWPALGASPTTRAPHLVFHWRHVISSLPPVDEVGVWPRAAQEVPLCGRAVLQARREGCSDVPGDGGPQTIRWPRQLGSPGPALDEHHQPSPHPRAPSVPTAGIRH